MIELILQIISCSVICIAIIEIYYIRKAYRSQLIMDLYDKWDSDSLTESRNLIQNLCDPSNNKLNMDKMVQLNKKDYLKALAVFNFFDVLGFFVKTKCLTVKDVKVLMGEGIIYYYEEVFEDYIMRRRERKEGFFKNFEYLKDECKKNTKIENLKHRIKDKSLIVLNCRIHYLLSKKGIFGKRTQKVK